MLQRHFVKWSSPQIPPFKLSISFCNKQTSRTGDNQKREMEGVEGESSAASNYTLRPSRIINEDILFCIDVDPESLVEMKVSGPNGRPFTRLDSIKQAILLFINAKLTINPDHRFAFATLAKSPSWVRTFFFLIGSRENVVF